MRLASQFIDERPVPGSGPVVCVVHADGRPDYRRWCSENRVQSDSILARLWGGLRPPTRALAPGDGGIVHPTIKPKLSPRRL